MRLVAAHADWSVDPRKRWVTVAWRVGTGWQAAAPRPVGDPAALVAELLRDGAALALGLDLPLGLPRRFAVGLPEPDFPAFLRRSGSRPGFWSVASTLEGVSRDSPFYPRRGLRGMTRAGHAAALGFAGPEELSRLCDRATAERPAGAPLFWTLGANQTGKAAISAWRDWLAPALAEGAPLDLWPFAGPLHGLLAPGRAALAEVYPAEAMRHAAVRLDGSKRTRTVRQRAAPALRDALARRRIAPDAALAEAVATGFGADAAGEDRLDSVLGLLGLIGVLDRARPDFVPDDPWVRRWEGWVLGQTSLPRGATAAERSGSDQPGSAGR